MLLFLFEIFEHQIGLHSKYIYSKLELLRERTSNFLDFQFFSFIKKSKRNTNAIVVNAYIEFNSFQLFQKVSFIQRSIPTNRYCKTTKSFKLFLILQKRCNWKKMSRIFLLTHFLLV